VSSFLWTVAMAVHLYVCIVRMDSITADRLVPYFHAACWFIPGRTINITCANTNPLPNYCNTVALRVTFTA
jgi:hypothetical protein